LCYLGIYVGSGIPLETNPSVEGHLRGPHTTATPVRNLNAATSIVEPVELRITDGARLLSVAQNGDLGVILDHGQKDKHVDSIPCNAEDTGVVVVSLDVDGGDHSEVHYTSNSSTPAVEVLACAIEAFKACHDASARVAKA
jgi:hypothetical protein